MTDGVTRRIKTIRKLAEGQVHGADGVIRPRPDEDDLNLLFAHVLGRDDGAKVMAYLRSITINMIQGPAVEPTELKHIEGQRYIIAIMERRIEHGRRTGAKPAEQPEPGRK